MKRLASSNWFQQYQNHIALHVIVFVWGFTGILGKVIQIPYYSIVWYRMLIAAVSLFLYLLLAKKQWDFSTKKLASFFGVGFIVAAHWATFFAALQVSNVSIVLSTLASTTLFVAFLEPLIHRRRIILYELVLGVLVILGLFLIFQFESQFSLGIVLSLFAAFFAALFSTLNGVLVRHTPSTQISFWEMFGGLVGMSIYILLFENFTPRDFSPSGLDIFYLLVLGVICTALAFVISVQVMKVLSPFTVSISVNMEPIYAIILALIFFGDDEKMTPGFYAGALIILGTVLANGALKQLKKRRG